MSETLPEIVPVRTTDRHTFELRPAKVDDLVRYVWHRVPSLTQRMCAIISPLSKGDLRAARALGATEAVSDEVLSKARVETFYKAAPCGGVDVLGEVHQYSLTTAIVDFSSVGADPFGVAPAESQP